MFFRETGTLLTIKTVLTAIAFAFTATVAAAVPVKFDINLISDNGAGGGGSFYVDSSDLANIPATGTYFGTAPINVNISVAGIVFDTVINGSWAASNGQVSGVTGICCSRIESSTTAGAYLTTHTGSGAPIQWFVKDANDQQLDGGQTYTVSQATAAVPLPASLPLFAAGFAAMGIAARRGRRT